ncbi:MAG: hypothetical protein WHT28_04300 [Fimbriimonadales bacterium]
METLPHLAEGTALLFTEESSWALCARERRELRFLPHDYNPVLIDKFLFAEHLCDIGEQPVPYWATYPPPKETLPYVVKPRCSWRGFSKNPRGFLCFTDADTLQSEKMLQIHGLKPDEIFVQRFLPDAQNISVAGFYDWRNPARQFFIATHKILGDSGWLNTGAIIQTTHFPQEIGMRVLRILNSLNYHGPFEMEFLYDARTNHYYVLELNPRFWMQHGLFLVGYENILIRAYLDEAFCCPLPVSNNRMLDYKPLLWVDSCYPFIALLRREIHPLRNYFDTIRAARRAGYSVYFFPEWKRAFRFALLRFGRRLLGVKARDRR